MLNLQAVNHFYGNQHSLWNVDLVLRPGECIGVLGREGMGKTTLVNCIAGHLPVASGRMTWHDIGAPPQDLTPLSAQSRSAIGIGYVPQDKRIFSQLSVEENLHIALAAGKPGANASGGEIYEHFPELYARAATSVQKDGTTGASRATNRQPVYNKFTVKSNYRFAVTNTPADEIHSFYIFSLLK